MWKASSHSSRSSLIDESKCLRHETRPHKGEAVKQFILGSRIDAVWSLKISTTVGFATIYSVLGKSLVNVFESMLLIATRNVEENRNSLA